MAISKKDLTKELKQLGAFHLTDMKDRRKVAEGILTSLIEDKLLQCAAEKEGIQISETELRLALRKSRRGYSNADLLQGLHRTQLTPIQFREQVRLRLIQTRYLSKHLGLAGQKSARDILRGLKNSIEWSIDHRAFLEAIGEA